MSRFIASDAHTCRPLMSPPNTGDWHGFDLNRWHRFPPVVIHAAADALPEGEGANCWSLAEGNVPERLKGQARKTVVAVMGAEGSNPSPSASSLSHR